MTLISGSAALSAFRQTLTGQYGLDLLEGAEGKLLVQLPIGVGKSRWLDAITLAALEQYPLVVILAPTRQLIGERRPLANPPENIRVVNLRPRPSERCGPERESAWRRFESRDLGALGRAEICGRCPLRQGCFWPDQFGASLEGARLIYATQAHIVRSPGFIPMLRQMSGAKTLLTLFDEAYFLDASPEEVIDRFDLLRFRAALRDARFIDPDLEALNRRWLDLVETLLGARTSDLTSGRWDFPSIRSDWALRVQEAGISLSGDSFRFLGFTLARFGASPAETRRRNARGDIEFADRPTVGDCIVFSGTTDPEFARLRTGSDFSAPFADHRFRHPETRFFNIASSIGTARHFGRHSDQILDFFAELVARRIGEGKRVLLFAKKRFVADCASRLSERLLKADSEAEVVTDGLTPGRLVDPRVVPLINYGVIGTNLFEDFDCAYCLGGYYINEAILESCLQGMVRRDLRVSMKIVTGGVPRRRRVEVGQQDRFTDVARIATSTLHHRENGTLLQAVGRVRPFTSPREVITFQMGEFPGVEFEREFQNLGEARAYFGIQTRRGREQESRSEQIAALRREGMTQADVAQMLGISERTVRNHETKGGNRKSSIFKK